MEKSSEKTSVEKLDFVPAMPRTEQYLESIFRSAFDPYVRLLGRELSENAYSWLLPSIKEGNIWLALSGKNVVGAVALIPEIDAWSIDQIAVPPQHQGQGIGSWMLKKIDARARNRGIKKLTLDTAKMMTDLIKLYEGNGFRIVREGQPKHNKDAHIRVYMEKSLE